MNLIVAVIEPPQTEAYIRILRRLKLPLNLELRGRGTASGSVLALLGLESNPKCALLSVVGEANTPRLMDAVRRELYIDAPGNGIAVAIPIKSVGGAKTLAYLNPSGASGERTPRVDYQNEMILAITNEGSGDGVMEAARQAGARGGTILHGKAMAKGAKSHFYNVTISDEKEIILIVAPASEKTAIMSRIMREAGPDTAAGTVVFSVPVSAAMGLNSSLPEEQIFPQEQ